MQKIKEISEQCRDQNFIDSLSPSETEEYISLLLNGLPPEERAESEKILSNERLLPLTKDKVIKSIFDPDTHPDRLQYILVNVFGKNGLNVTGSVKNEAAKRSVYTKGLITDIPSRINEKDIANTEMQVQAQEYISRRIEVYVSEYIIGQYTRETNRNELDPKEIINYKNIGDVYMCVLMKESPRLFKDNTEFMHHVRTVTDSGIVIPSISNVAYVELDKAKKKYLNKEYTSNNKEVCLLMAFIADINQPEIRKAVCGIPFYDSIIKDVKTMGYDRKGMLGMLAEKYEEMTMNLYKLQWFEEGMEKGRKEGEERGEKRGEERGEEKALFRSVDVMVNDFNIQAEKACKSLGVDYDSYISFKKGSENKSVNVGGHELPHPTKHR